MKKVLLTIVLFTSILKATADEGMWLPMLLGEQVYADMVKRGLKLTKDQLYSMNKSSLKDAIILFNDGCTAEVVSEKGLIFTNHHCGYDAISKASTVEHNYMKDGFYAKNLGEEIQSTVFARFLESITDVTKEVEDSLVGLTGAARLTKQASSLRSITDRIKDDTKGKMARIYGMFKNNQFLLFTYKTYNDVRLVGTPPESIGKFGGDTDNWEWPRHTGDFSIFRIYMAKDGSPAKYSADNIPYKPKYSLPVSIKGVKDGDYAMIYGYPGGTSRYETSLGVKMKTDISNPTLVNLRDMRLKNMFTEMQKSAAVKLKIGSSYAGIANYWKFFDGETKQLKKFRTFEEKQAYEAKFQSWANGKPEFENVFKDYEANYATWMPYEKQRVNLVEGILGSPLMANSASMIALAAAIEKKDFAKMIDGLDKARAGIKESLDLPSDERIMAKAVEMYYNDVDKAQHPEGIFAMIASKYGDLNDEVTYKKMAKDMVANSLMLNDDKWNTFKTNPTIETLNTDIAYYAVAAFNNNYTKNYAPKRIKFTQTDQELGRMYLKGIMQMNPTAAKKMYPDANLSMRVSFGNVKSYAPKDAVKYDYVCTSAGFLQKYVKGDYEFDLQDYIMDAVRKKDFGQYIDKGRNDLVTTFITTNDITGGNSGSPVINGNGELIGLAFDGNYEALSHKIAFDKDLNRTICVDIRYVLWCIDKLGGAKNIISELKLVK
jgi:Peptidase S46